ncbi:MAG TPA: lipopolysaccharide biosynthesis protein, partial [Roseiflexaceae bacterium]|nr:lipopolysaccharide biosynthesis protein [Roseiflexaceae bacterium]
MITWPEIVQLLRTLLRWSWVIILAVALATGTAYYLSAHETRYYVSRATLMIGNTLSSQQPQAYELQLGSALGGFYSELARREPVLKAVQEQLQLSFPWEVIRDEMLRTQVVAKANLLEISIIDSNPERAAAIANAIAAQLIAYSPTSPDKIAAEQQALLGQLRDSEARIEQIKATINATAERQKQAGSASDLAEINQKLVQLQASLSQEQETYSRLLFLKNNSVVNSLSVFESARPAVAPLPSQRRVMIAVAALAGFVLAVAAVLILDRVDTRWRTPRDLENRFDVKMLGNVPKGPPIRAATGEFATSRLMAVRNVQTNILLAAAEHGTRTLVITSPHSSEARATLSIDLADLFARSGSRVLLVDVDPTEAHLTRLLAAHPNTLPWARIASGNPADIWGFLAPTQLPNVALLPAPARVESGPTLLPSQRWPDLVQVLGGTADVVIFDGPPALDGPDAALLGPHVDGVVLALDPTQDSREDVLTSKTRLVRLKGAHLLGAVIFLASEQGANVWKLPGVRHPELPAHTTEEVAGAPTITPIFEQEEVDTPEVVVIDEGAGADDRRDQPAAGPRQRP